MKNLQKKYGFRDSFLITLLYISFLMIFPSISYSDETYELKEMQINNSTKFDNTGSVNIPTNPFEVVDMIRRVNSMNDATKPSDAIDQASESFDMINDNQNI